MTVTMRTVRDVSYAAGTTLGPHIEEFLTAKQASRHFTDKTVRNYRIYLSEMATQLRDVQPADVRVEDLERIQASFPQGSMTNANASFRSFWKWMRQRQRVPANPGELLETPKRSKVNKIKMFNDAEYEALIAQPDIRDAALMRLLLDSGLRADEFCALRLLHVNCASRRVQVVRGKGNKSRTVPIPKGTAEAVNLMALTEGMEPTDYLVYRRVGGFGSGKKVTRTTQVSYSRFRRWFVDCLETVGVEYQNPHTTRHTFASRWISKNGNIAILSRMMGHESIAVTVDTYSHLMLGDLQAEVDRLEAVELVER